MLTPYHDEGYVSSIVLMGLLLRPEVSGDDGLPGAVKLGVTTRPDESTPGEECALCIKGIAGDEQSRECVLGGEWFPGRRGNCVGVGVEVG